MGLKELYELSTESKELYIGGSYFHGDKVQALLKTLKKHFVEIEIQTSFLNKGNCPDLVINYSGPSVGRFVFHGQVFSRPEILSNARQVKEVKRLEEEGLKAQKKAKRLEEKELKAKNKKGSRK